MKLHERAQIEILLKREFSIPQIARELNRPAMTITREIKNRRIDSNKCCGYPEQHLPFQTNV